MDLVNDVNGHGGREKKQNVRVVGALATTSSTSTSAAWASALVVFMVAARLGVGAHNHKKTESET